MTGTKILVVEDARDLLEEVVDFLRFSNFDAHGVGSLAEMHEQLSRSAWQVVVLDLGLPDGDGVVAARELRAQHGLLLGLVIVSARGRLDDRLSGRQAGADAYLTKPVALRELKAVIDSLLLRLPHAEPADGDLAPYAAAPRWALDRASLALRSPCGQVLPLTGTEARMLALLMQARGRVLSREQLCRALDARGAAPDTRRLDTLISRLRSKAEASDLCLPLHTYRNLGYAFEAVSLPSPSATADSSVHPQ
jgi:DNA-binding response OmpR family regulator